MKAATTNRSLRKRRAGLGGALQWVLPLLLASSGGIAAADDRGAGTELLNLLQGSNVESVVVFVEDPNGADGETWIEFTRMPQKDGTVQWAKRTLMPQPLAEPSADIGDRGQAGRQETTAAPLMATATAGCGAFPCEPQFRAVRRGSVIKCRPCP